MEESLDDFRKFLPPHLTSEAANELTKRLRKFPENQDVYLPGQIDREPLQGDAWRGFSIYAFESGAVEKRIAGVVLSNSCDLAAATRVEPSFVTFAPILKLDVIKSILLATGKTEEQLGSKFEAIRKQQISSMFYLPPWREMPECVALFDQMHSLPTGVFEAENPSHLFTLNDYGFYVLLLKLAQHFCRMGEGVDRSSGKATVAPTVTLDLPQTSVVANIGTTEPISTRARHLSFPRALKRTYSKELSATVFLAGSVCFAGVFDRMGNELDRSRAYATLDEAKRWADDRVDRLGGETKGDWEPAF